MFKEKIFLFGASLFCSQVISYFKESDVEITGIFDNNSKKIGSVFCGIDVKNPVEIKNEQEIIVLITSMYYEEIKKQIQNLNQNARILSVYDFILNDLVKEEQILGKEDFKSSNNLIIGLHNAITIGGVETWTYNFKKNLENNFDEIEIFLLNKFNEEQQSYKVKILSEVERLSKKLPMVVIPNLCEELFLIAILLKIKFGYVKIISTAHSDFDFTYRQQLRYEKYIDKFICVSEEIRKKLSNMLPNREDDMEILLPVMKVEKEKYLKNYILNIVYVGRLEIEHKRVDKLLRLEKELKRIEVDYKLHIVGDGEQKKYLEKFLDNNKTIFYGNLSNLEVKKVLRKMDIFINISDLEGTSIAMVEALEKGLTPVVTDVSGVKSFIENEKNGFIVACDGMEEMAKKIKFLDENKFVLEKNFYENKRIVSKLCNHEIYRNKFLRSIQKIKISVIIPTYNSRKFIRKAIESILNQTYQNLEIIIIDDGSTDDTKKIINEFKDIRIKYFYKENGGEASARNYGLSKIRGQYVTFVDADDYIAKERLEKQLKYLTDNIHKDAVYTNVQVIGELGEKREVLRSEVVVKNDRDYLPIMLHRQVIPATATLMIKKEVINSGIRYPENYKNSVDYMFSLKIAERFNIGYMDEELYFYRRHNNNLTNNHNNQLRTEVEIVKEFGIDKIKKIIKNSSFSNFEKTFLLAKIFMKIEENILAKNILNEVKEKNEYIYFYIGNLNYMENNLEEAKMNYLKSLEINNNLAETYNNLGVVLMMLGEEIRAKKCFEKAIEINDIYMDANYNVTAKSDFKITKRELRKQLTNYNI